MLDGRRQAPCVRLGLGPAALIINCVASGRRQAPSVRLGLGPAVLIINAIPGGEQHLKPLAVCADSAGKLLWTSLVLTSQLYRTIIHSPTGGVREKNPHYTVGPVICPIYINYCVHPTSDRACFE